MKKLILLFSILNCSCSIINCSAQCVPDGSITTPGIIASPSTVDCINRGYFFTDVIQFMNFDSIYFNGNWVTLQQLRIDSVNNLPCGINWQLSNSNGVYANSEPGCIWLSGISNDSVGQYKLDVWASIDLGTGFFGPLQANNFDLLTFYTRVKDFASFCPGIDTTAYNHLGQCNSTYGLQLTINTNNDFLCWNYGDVALINAHIENGSGHYSYQWNYSDSLSCDTCPSVLFDSQIFQTGIFPVSVTVYDSISTLSATQSIDMTVNICGGVDENEQRLQLLVYPNPGNGNYIIQLPENFSANYKLSVSDMHGRKIKSETEALSSTRLSLAIDDATPGIYFLFVTEGEKIYVNKLVKK